MSLPQIRKLIAKQNALADRFTHGSEEWQVFVDTQMVLEDLINYVKEVSKALTNDRR